MSDDEKKNEVDFEKSYASFFEEDNKEMHSYDY